MTDKFRDITNAMNAMANDPVWREKFLAGNATKAELLAFYRVQEGMDQRLARIEAMLGIKDEG